MKGDHGPTKLLHVGPLFWTFKGVPFKKKKKKGVLIPGLLF